MVVGRISVDHASADLIVKGWNADDDWLVRDIVIRSEQSRIHEKRATLLRYAVAPVDMTKYMQFRLYSLDCLQQLWAPGMVIGAEMAV